MIRKFRDSVPEIDESAYIDKTALVIGNVKIGKNSVILPNAVLRGDIAQITIGDNSNVQDNSTVHTCKDHPTTIGNNVTIGHNCVMHGCTIRDNVLIGMGAIVLNNANIEEGCIIGAGALVTENKTIPKNSLVIGVPGKIVREVKKEELQHTLDNAEQYVSLGKAHAKNGR